MTTSSPNLRELQAPLKARYREQPESALATMRVRSVASDLSDPFHCASSPDVAPEVVWRSGAHHGTGAPGDAPCSGDLLLGALAACQEITVRMVAAAMGIELDRLEVEVEGDFDLRGTMGIDREAPIGLTDVRSTTRVAFKEGTDPERGQRLLANAERYCVVLSTLRNGVPVASRFEVGE
jgi:uncharacterized OsmC-like protein